MFWKNERLEAVDKGGNFCNNERALLLVFSVDLVQFSLRRALGH